MSDAQNANRRGFLGATIITIAGVQLGMIGSLLRRVPPAAGQIVAGGRELKSLGHATEWLNSTPLTAESLRGRVVLIDFWTYTCINWLRTLPDIRAWVDKYRNQGLVVISVHAPEFSFEHDLENVRRAVERLQIEHPVAIDNEYAIWRAFRNRYWPALYLLDAQGRVRHHQFGEGRYEEAEKEIQRLLTEAGVGAIDGTAMPLEGQGVEAAADWTSLKSLETYLGYSRTGNFVSVGGESPDRRRIYTAPARLSRNQWALSGEWTMGAEAVVLHEAGGRVINSFHARDLHLVMGPATRDAEVRFRVRVDGRAPGPARGLDVDERGDGTITEPRMYQLLRQPMPIVDRQFEIEFLDPGVAAYAITYG